MENSEQQQRCLSELIKHAEECGKQIVIIGCGGEIGIHAAAIAKMMDKKELILVDIKDLPEEDQQKLSGTVRMEQSPRFDTKEFIIKASPPMEDFSDIILTEKKSIKKQQQQNNHNFNKGFNKNNNFKGNQRNFKGRRK